MTQIPAAPHGLPLRHALLALAVAAVWGTNFVVIRWGLDSFPPLLFALLRFVFVFFPACLFIRRPEAPWLKLAAYGVLIGAGQFGLLYIAMGGHISAGLASLVVQCQVFFTIGLSVVIAGERVRGYQWLAVALAASGLVLIGLRGGGDASPLGLILVMSAGLSWAFANVLMKRTPLANMLSYVVWASVFSLPPLLILSLVFEGPATILHALAVAKPAAWAAVAWQSVGNSLFGYAVWGWLLSRYPAASVTPTALLVPVFGMAAAAALLGEPLQTWKVAAAGLVLSGLCLNLLTPRYLAWREARAAVLPPAS
jgi:O-acetylserine/cysteine efflux transporter